MSPLPKMIIPAFMGTTLAPDVGLSCLHLGLLDEKRRCACRGNPHFC